jgi:hypothetical protein
MICSHILGLSFYRAKSKKKVDHISDQLFI